MPGPELALDVFVVLRLRIGIFHQQGNRRAGGAVLEDAREDLYIFFFATLRGMAAFSRGTPQQLRPDFTGRDLQARRATIDNATDGRTVTFAKGADPQHMSKTVIRHLVRLL